MKELEQKTSRLSHVQNDGGPNLRPKWVIVALIYNGGRPSQAWQNSDIKKWSTNLRGEGSVM